jgi:flagellar biosynthesis regulator FlbT
MTLKLTLRVGEAIHIGKLRLVVEAKSTCTIFIDGSAPVLRETECVSADAADPVSRLRYALQRMYLEGEPLAWLSRYLAAATAVVDAMPAETARVAKITDLVSTGDLWSAIRASRTLSRSLSATEERLAS